MTAPVDHDLLADYVGGALEGTPEAARVAGLIATSPAWRTAADQLTLALGAVSDDLQALSGYPEKMPADIAGRFEEFLASPALKPQPANPPKDPLAGRSVHRSSSSGRRQKGWRKWAVPVAAVAIATAGFFALRPNLPGGVELSTANPASQAEAPGSGKAVDTLTQAVPVPTIASGRDYNRQSTEAGVPPAVEPQRTSLEKLPQTFSSSRTADGAANLKACLQEVAKVLPGTVTLVDYASFEGNPALVISITTPTGRWMFVAGPSCGINGAHEIFRTPLK